MSAPNEPLLSLLPLGKPGPGLLGPVPLFHARFPLKADSGKGNPGDGLLGPSPFHGGILSKKFEGPHRESRSAFDLDACLTDRPGKLRCSLLGDADPPRPSFGRSNFRPTGDLGPMFDYPGRGNAMSDGPKSLLGRFDSRQGGSGNYECRPSDQERFGSRPSDQEYFGSRRSDKEYFGSRPSDQEYFGSRFDGPRNFRLEDREDRSRFSSRFDDRLESSFNGQDYYDRGYDEENRFGSIFDQKSAGGPFFGSNMRNASERSGFKEPLRDDRYGTWTGIMEWEDGQLGFSEREPPHIRKAYDAAYQIGRRNPVGILQELCEREGWRNPKYHILMDGKNRNKFFQFEVELNGQGHDVGRYSYTETQARIYAAIRTLYNLGELF